MQRKTSSLDSYKIQSNDGCSWKAMAGQAHNCVGGPGGHLGSFEHSAVLGPASKCVFWLKFMFIVPHLGFVALVLEHCWMDLSGRVSFTAETV